MATNRSNDSRSPEELAHPRLHFGQPRRWVGGHGRVFLSEFERRLLDRWREVEERSPRTGVPRLRW